MVIIRRGQYRLKPWNGDDPEIGELDRRKIGRENARRLFGLP